MTVDKKNPSIRDAVSPEFYKSIVEILRDARAKAYRAVNFTMVEAYWNVGRMIVEEEQHGKERADYGTFLIRNLSSRLMEEFGKGFTEANLRNFRQFFIFFPIRDAVRHKSSEDQHSASIRESPVPIVNAVRSHSPKTHNIAPVPDGIETIWNALRSKSPKIQKSESLSDTQDLIRYALRSELSWTHYRLLIRVENQKAREWYMNEAADQNWSTRALERQINTLYYERLRMSQDKTPVKSEASENTKALAAKPEDFIKDPYVLEFLNISEKALFRICDFKLGRTTPGKTLCPH